MAKVLVLGFAWLEDKGAEVMAYLLVCRTCLIGWKLGEDKPCDCPYVVIETDENVGGGDEKS
jgi:hypothetical protein